MRDCVTYKIRERRSESQSRRSGAENLQTLILIIMASMVNLQFRSVPFQPKGCVVKRRNQMTRVIRDLRTQLELFTCSIDWEKPHFKRRSFRNRFILRAVSPSADAIDNKSDENNKNKDQIEIEVTAAVAEEKINTNNNVKEVNLNTQVLRLQQAVTSLCLPLFMMRRQSKIIVAIGISILAIMLVVMRVFAIKKSRNKRPGTVADLVRRGQLKSDRRGISTTLKYDDPFNNPMVKVDKGKSTVEMCGKVYRLAPVTLTREQRAIHQRRRSRAYQWKRPTVFLKEGDPIPPDVDPDTIRWIPANHPFATTASDLDEDLAQNNVYQKHGVPYRIQAEHEALQKKLEALQSEQKLNKLVIDPSAAKEFERPFKSHQRSDEHVDLHRSDGHLGSKSSKFRDMPISPSGNGSTSEDDEVPKT